ncbi:uncharacterized protein [Macrobrachium rosenbergii]|uniref:uncharacterized protein n=1 Tax=Macrobrachium rosenbergii TaxID=79674 RepID=UPI0034D745AE
MKSYHRASQTDLQERALIIWLRMAGIPTREIARESGCSLSTVYRWLRRWKGERTLVNKNKRRYFALNPLASRIENDILMWHQSSLARYRQQHPAVEEASPLYLPRASQVHLEAGASLWDVRRPLPEVIPVRDVLKPLDERNRHSRDPFMLSNITVLNDIPFRADALHSMNAWLYQQRYQRPHPQ